MPPIEANETGVLFAMGVENGSNREFETSNWAGVKHYECTVGIDCNTETIPYRLHVASMVKAR
jgi:hypothetical protein